MAAHLAREGYAVNFSSFIAAKTLGDMLSHVQDRTDDLARSVERPKCEFKICTLTANSPRKDICEFVSADLLAKENMTRSSGLSYDDSYKLADGFFDAFVSCKASVVCYKTESDNESENESDNEYELDNGLEKGTLVGVSLSYDPPQPVDYELTPALERIWELQDAAELVLKSVPDKGKLLSSYVTAVSLHLTMTERLEVVYLLESAVVDCARRQGYDSVEGVNSNPATQVMITFLERQFTGVSVQRQIDI